MPYSLHLICTIPEDYRCNELTLVAETRLGLLAKLVALFFSKSGKAKFCNGFKLTAKDIKLQKSPDMIINNRKIIIRKRIAENKLQGKIAEVAFLSVLSFEVPDIATELGIDEKTVSQYLSDLKTHFKVNSIEEIKPILTLRNNLSPVVPPIPSVPPADTAVK